MPSPPNASVSASTTVGSEHGAAGMRLFGVRSIRFRFVWACLAAACSPFLERESPGVFYDVQLAASAPSTLCLELATDVAARTDLLLRWHGALQRPDPCAALVNDGTALPRLETWSTMDRK